MTKQDLIAIQRVFNTDEGNTLLNYLKELSNKNYENLIHAESNDLAHFQGKAKVLFELIAFVESLDKKVEAERNKLNHELITSW